MNFPAAIRAPITALFGRPGDRAVLIVLGAFALAWTAFQILAHLSVDLHPDVLENIAWGRHPGWGYWKHPPLGGWMIGAWFAVMPMADWSAHLFATLNATAALFVVDRIARLYLPADKRILVLLLLMLTPFYQVHAIRFASNQTLLLMWPLAVWCFLRAFQTRTLLWSAAAGVAAALAMLGKYYSVYLLAGFLAAALVHPARAAYWRSASPWMSAAVGALVLAPHLHWLVTTGYQPFQYAFAVHGNVTLARSLLADVNYVLGALAYMLLPLIVFVAIARPPRAVWRETLWPSDPERRMLAVLLWVPLAMPLIVAPLTASKLTSIWTMQAWFLLPILLLSAPGVNVRKDRAESFAAIAAMLTILAIVVAPAFAWVRHVKGTNQSRGYYALASQELTQRWRAAYATPLRLVTGDLDFSAAALFYSADRPDYVPSFDLKLAPWATGERVMREGYAVICEDDDTTCIARARKEAADGGGLSGNFTVTRRFLGADNLRKTFVYALIPPRR